MRARLLMEGDKKKPASEQCDGPQKIHLPTIASKNKKASGYFVQVGQVTYYSAQPWRSAMFVRSLT
ncbi:hypothetical protein RE428_31200 [Marinobacter nanhaiticus D15-8W]|nr:hypothetical protein RE428_31200 [Marinobacter nanhaiticus D15-8W]